MEDNYEEENDEQEQEEEANVPTIMEPLKEIEKK